MKRIFLLLIITSAGISSCKKILDTTPDGNLVPANSYGSVAQINAALSGIYTNLKYTIGYSQFYTAYFTAPTDETYFYNTNGFSSFANTANDATTGNPSNLWRGCYQSINFANTLLDNIDASAGDKVDANIVRRAKGEAMFMRGFYYFLLAQWYGDVPLQLHATADPSQSQVSRTAVKDVYNQLIDDMTKADSLLYDQTFSSLGYSDKITRAGVQAMLTRVCLYAAGQPVGDTKRYAEAISWANKVIASGQHSLSSSYPQIFIDEAKNVYNRENIWEIGFIQNATGTVSSAGGIGVYIGVSQGTSNGTSSTGSVLYDSGYVYSYMKLHPRHFFRYEPGDYRREWNIANYNYGTASAAPSTSDGKIGAYSASAVATKSPLLSTAQWNRQPAKWRREYESQISRSTQMTSSTNFPVIRYADVLLMRAEAEFEVNGATAVAFDAINQVRRRSISTTKIVDSVSFVIGTGYNAAPDSVTWTNGGGTGFTFNIVYTPAAKSVQVLMTGQGSGFTSAPVITIGRQWRAATAYAVNAQIAAGGRLYTVTTAGTSTATAPTNTTGASSAATTGAVFTYAGVAATATAYLSATPVVDLNASVLAAKGIDLRQAIRDERSRELCYEALRLPDLKRWGILVPTIQSLALDIAGTNPAFPLVRPVLSELAVGSDAPPLAPVQSVSQKDMFLPIPTYDLNLNKKLTQNPGY